MGGSCLPSSITRALAQSLTAWQAHAPELLEAARLLLLDGVAVAAAGASEPSATIAAGLARETEARPQASVIGHGFATSLVGAARINGISMHALDYEPMWFPPNHVLSCVLPAVLALAESMEQQGREPLGLLVLEALAKGVEAQGRLRLASGQLEPRDVTLHPPSAVGAIAAAAASAHLLGLDESTTATALGIASSRLGGTLANVGSMTKALHCGDAAANGLEAAQLASRGFTSDADAIGGPRGWGPVLFGDRFDPRALQEPVDVPRILDPGPAWKLFPSQFATHFAISAALDARRQIADPAAIARVVLRVPDMPYIDRPAPESGLAGKFSWQYTVAAALLDGRVDRETFADSRRFSADMEVVLACIELVRDKSIPGEFTRMHVEAHVHTRDGEVIRSRCDGPPGSWQGPPPAPGAIHAKARGLLEGAFGSSVSDRVMALAAGPAASLRVAELMSLLRGGA